MHNETDDQLEIGRRIQERLDALCEKKGISRRKLAKKMGIREDYLGKMVRGKRPWNLNYLKQVADGLDVTLDALLGDTFELPVVAEIGGGKEN